MNGNRLYLAHRKMTSSLVIFCYRVLPQSYGRHYSTGSHASALSPATAVASSSAAAAVTVSRRHYVSSTTRVLKAVPSQAHVDTSEMDGGEYDREQHVASAESRLRRVFGPQAKLVFHRLEQSHLYHQKKLQQRQQAGEEGIESDTTRSGAAATTTAAAEGGEDANFYYRASATFRLLGFAVELAATKGKNAHDTVEKCVLQALNSDIEFIRPDVSASNSLRSSSAHGGRRRQQQQQYRHHNSSEHQQYLSLQQKELKAVADELRELCAHFSRNVKFSIKPPRLHSSSPGTEEQEQLHQQQQQLEERECSTSSQGPFASDQWRCRAYLKDEWSPVAHMGLALEETGATPREALGRALAALRTQFRVEADSPEVMLASVAELRAVLAPQGKAVTAQCMEDAPAQQSGSCDGEQDGSGQATVNSSNAGAHHDNSMLDMVYPRTYTGIVSVEDAAGNVSVTQARKQVSRLAAHQVSAWAAMKTELPWDFQHSHMLSSRVPLAPLLHRLRWQLEAMSCVIGQVLGKSPTEVSTVTVVVVEEEGSESESAQGGGGAGVFFSKPELYTATFFSEGAVVWQETGAGRYRVEFDGYVQALYYLLDQYSDVIGARRSRHSSMFDGDGGACLFAAPALLEYAVARHDQFDLVAHHRGRWNCYALLGTITSQLLGCFFQTRYARVPGGKDDWVATITVSDPVAGSEMILARGVSSKRGEAWRLACLSALRENFPRQYEAVLRQHPDVDLSADTMARGSRYRALPREKRVRHIGHLFALVAAFGDEDLGWQQLRIRLRNASGDLGFPQWVAEMEAHVEGESNGGRRVVAVSPAFSQARMARRVLTYRVAEQYFPKELAVYKTLYRRDSMDPLQESTMMAHKNSFDYRPGAMGFVTQLLALLEARHLSHRPFSWTLEARHLSEQPSFTPQSAEEGEEEVVQSVLVSDGGHGAGNSLSAAEMMQSATRLLLYPLRLRYDARVLGCAGDLLVCESEGTEQDSAVVVLTNALKGASKALGGARAETMWIDFETQAFPNIYTPKQLAVYLFNTFFGTTACLSSSGSQDSGSSTVAASSSGDGCGWGDEDEMVAKDDAAKVAAVAAAHTKGEDEEEQQHQWSAVLDLQSVQVADYWFTTVVLPRIGCLPIARAINTSKRDSAEDALILAARKSFPRILHHLAKHDSAMAALATHILSEPVVEQLPDHVVETVRQQLARKPRRGPRPLVLLAQCVRREYGHVKRLRIQQTQMPGSGFECRIYLQPNRIVIQRGEAQLVGFGSGMESDAAVQAAALMALENLFESSLPLTQVDKTQSGGGGGSS